MMVATMANTASLNACRRSPRNTCCTAAEDMAWTVPGQRSVLLLVGKVKRECHLTKVAHAHFMSKAGAVLISAHRGTPVSLLPLTCVSLCSLS